MKFIEAFEKIKKNLSEFNFENKGEDFAIQITLSNKECGGTFYIEVKDNDLLVEPYDYNDNNAAIDIMYGDFTKLCDKKLSVKKALETEKLTVFGDISAVETFVASLKKIQPKKQSAPKKTVKKTTEKPSKKTK